MPQKLSDSWTDGCKKKHGLEASCFVKNHPWKMTTLLCSAVHNSLGAILDPNLTQPCHAVEKFL
eukprot:14511729-Ditylum_brightwellii.AAC.1